MDEQTRGFRSAIFGGFNREDVMHYIEETDTKYYTETAELRSQLTEAQSAMNELRTQNEALTAKNAELLERLGEMTLDTDKIRAQLDQIESGFSLQATEIEAQNARAADMTVYDSVLLGRRPYIGWDATEHDREVVREVIDLMGIGDYELRSVAELSGGEAQKVMLARALAQEPRLLLLDEPTSNLDPRNQHEALRTIRRVAKERNISVCIILHDLNLAIRYCDRFLFLKDSEVYAYGGEEVMTPENIEAVYRMHVHIMSYMGIPHIIPFPDIRL